MRQHEVQLGSVLGAAVTARTGQRWQRGCREAMQRYAREPDRGPTEASAYLVRGKEASPRPPSAPSRPAQYQMEPRGTDRGRAEAERA